MLSVTDLASGYGARNVLHGLSLAVPAQSIVTVLGANGAGKTTLMKSIVGILKPTAGQILLEGQPLDNRTPDRALKQGVALVAEQRELFSAMSVADNLFLGGYLRPDRRQVSRDIEEVIEIFPNLKARMKQAAGLLSGGEQQMLAIARSMISKPRLLLLDEPSLGLAPIIIDEIFEKIRKIKQDGVSILLVEQNVSKALEVADYGYVLEVGEIKVHGTPYNLMQSKEVQKAYF